MKTIYVVVLCLLTISCTNEPTRHTETKKIESKTEAEEYLWVIMIAHDWGPVYVSNIIKINDFSSDKLAMIQDNAERQLNSEFYAKEPKVYTRSWSVGKIYSKVSQARVTYLDEHNAIPFTLKKYPEVTE